MGTPQSFTQNTRYTSQRVIGNIVAHHTVHIRQTKHVTLNTHISTSKLPWNVAVCHINTPHSYLGTPRNIFSSMGNGPDLFSDSVVRSCQLIRKPVERTNEIISRLISLVHFTGFPHQLIGSHGSVRKWIGVLRHKTQIAAIYCGNTQLVTQNTSQLLG